jgi:hypothetical protein
VPDPTAELDATIDDAAEGPMSNQQCGRCRKVFEMEISPTEPGTIPEMWLCASCRVALLGRPTAVTRHHD